MFEIKTDLPEPPLRRGTRPRKYPFEATPVGGYFLVPASELPPKGIASIKAAIAGNRKRFPGMRFRAHPLGESVGVWRVE